MGSQWLQMGERLTTQTYPSHHQDLSKITNPNKIVSYDTCIFDVNQHCSNDHNKGRCVSLNKLSECCTSWSPFFHALLLGVLTAGSILAVIIALWLTSSKQGSTTESTNIISTSTILTTTATCSPIFNSTSGLVAYFPMDSSPSYLTDVDATLTATAVAVTNVAGERNQCLSFMGTINSYFQISNLTSLGSSTTPFSIALYISPNVLSGTIVHVSAFKNGTDAWCLPFIGFANTTHLAIQIWNRNIAKYVLGPIPPLNSWTHIVQTWSPVSGMSLYINGELYAQDSTVTTYGASGVPNYLTLASTLEAIPYPLNGCSTTGVLGGLGYYNGLIDELRVYSRALSALEVCALAKY